MSRVNFAEEKVFFSLFLSEFFRILSENFFRLSAKNLQKVVKTTFCVTRVTICGLKIFFKSFESFWIFCRNLWHCSQVSIYVSRVKFWGRKSFFFILPFWIFPDFERKFFQTFGRKTSRICQNYLLRVQRNNLWLNIYFKSFKSFWIFCRSLWNGSQVSIYVSRVKFAEENVFFFILPFWIFPDFERKFFQTFGEKSSKSCQNYLLRDQRNNLWLENFF